MARRDMCSQKFSYRRTTRTNSNNNNSSNRHTTAVLFLVFQAFTSLSRLPAVCFGASATTFFDSLIHKVTIKPFILFTLLCALPFITLAQSRIAVVAVIG
mmetsp:Transcript_16725/g.28359  ORF Transcript_16725/g.28359 Transcript_16725/m.28359 type:complete len:100 (-) Transcript_16725:1400-1699(-)